MRPRRPLAITIACEPQAKYGRAIDVLNALAAAHIDNVTFTSTKRSSLDCLGKANPHRFSGR